MKLILIRHGLSEANVDHTVYFKKYDHDIELTSEGKSDAQKIGKRLKPIICPDSKIYVSPYKRTIQTWEAINKSLIVPSSQVLIETRIREQEYKQFKNDQDRKKAFKKQIDKKKLWYRFEHGESGADLLSRVGSFIETLGLNCNLYHEKNDVIVICHEIVIRSFLIKVLNLGLDDFENLPDIENCSPIVLDTKDMRSFVFNQKETFKNLKLKKYLKNRN